jgi:hypothetical protein
MGAQAVDRHWYISRHGKRYGPYTFAALTEAAAKGVITADTNVWRLGWVSWHPAWQVPGLIEEHLEVKEFAEEGGSIVPAQERPDGGVDAAAGLSHPQDRREEHRVSATQSRDAAADDDAAPRAVAQDDPEIALEGALEVSPQDAGRAESEDRPRIAPQDARRDTQPDSPQGTLPDGQPDAPPDVSETAFPDAIADKPRPVPNGCRTATSRPPPCRAPPCGRTRRSTPNEPVTSAFRWCRPRPGTDCRNRLRSPARRRGGGGAGRRHSRRSC